MAFSFVMSFEVLALEIADEHISLMTDSNVYYDRYDGELCDEAAFQNNLKNGTVVMFMLNSFVESFLNTILRDCICYNGDKLLKSNLEDKLEFLYLYYKADIMQLRSHHYWGAFKKLNRIRNELTHYKTNHIGFSGISLPIPWSKPFEDIDVYFTESKLRDVKNEIEMLCGKIASDFGLSINSQPMLFDSPDRDVDFSYVFNPTYRGDLE